MSQNEPKKPAAPDTPQMIDERAKRLYAKLRDAHIALEDAAKRSRFALGDPSIIQKETEAIQAEVGVSMRLLMLSIQEQLILNRAIAIEGNKALAQILSVLEEMEAEEQEQKNGKPAVRGLNMHPLHEAKR